MLFTFLVPVLYFLPLIIFSKELGNLGDLSFLGILGLIITFIGLAIWIAGFLSLGLKSFAVLPKAKILQTKGVYKYFRHPIYFGITLSILGLSICLGSFSGLIYTALVIIPLNIFRAKREEKILLQKFGEEYKRYQTTTLF